MSGSVLILRPEPGASATARKARATGLDPVATPIFELQAVEWDPPQPRAYDCLLLTSANAPRLAGNALSEYRDLPCYAVGENTAAAAREAGLAEPVSGPSDGAALLVRIAEDGLERALHLCGRDHIPLQHSSIMIDRCIVYASETVDALPREAAEALAEGAIALIHSPRAGATFARLIEAAGLTKSPIRIAAISEAAAIAVGPDWGEVAVAGEPRDDALLELAAKLCKTGGSTNGIAG